MAPGLRVSGESHGKGPKGTEVEEGANSGSGGSGLMPVSLLKISMSCYVVLISYVGL